LLFSQKMWDAQTPLRRPRRSVFTPRASFLRGRGYANFFFWGGGEKRHFGAETPPAWRGKNRWPGLLSLSFSSSFPRVAQGASGAFGLGNQIRKNPPPPGGGQGGVGGARLPVGPSGVGWPPEGGCGGWFGARWGFRVFLYFFSPGSRFFRGHEEEIQQQQGGRSLGAGGRRFFWNRRVHLGSHPTKARGGGGPPQGGKTRGARPPVRSRRAGRAGATDKRSPQGGAPKTPVTPEAVPP